MSLKNEIKLAKKAIHNVSKYNQFKKLVSTNKKPSIKFCAPVLGKLISKNGKKHQRKYTTSKITLFGRRIKTIFGGKTPRSMIGQEAMLEPYIKGKTLC